ncbi:hypothetical protein [Xanthomonas arboricola]|uniref:hypothetical protein n=1 Tax=Xanthomonas arboricola TaxID=56448 RepID=UPI0011B0F25A|nr:hypothetical protein [Xanthomonas arboricola]
MVAKLWEDTVVTALRDAQWMNCKGYALPQTFPPGFVKLDGMQSPSIMKKEISDEHYELHNTNIQKKLNSQK